MKEVFDPEEIKKRFSVPHNNLFITGLLLLMWFLLFELTSRIYNLYYSFPYIDIPSHFFAGLASFVLGFWILNLTKVKHKKWGAMIITFAVAVFWEILETLEQLIVEDPPYLIDIFWWDGFFDIVATMVGAVVAIYVLKLIKNKLHIYWETCI